MSTTKTLNTRIQHKIDTHENWLKAANFKPLKGELIVYTNLLADETDLTSGTGKVGIKIGDGSTVVNNLEFLSADSNNTTNLPLITGGVDNQSLIMFGVDTSKSYSKYNFASGNELTVGQKAFRINLTLPEPEEGEEQTGVTIPQEWIDNKCYEISWNKYNPDDVSLEDFHNAVVALKEAAEAYYEGSAEDMLTYSIRLTEHRYNYAEITSVELLETNNYGVGLYDTARIHVVDMFTETVTNEPYIWVLKKPDIGVEPIGNAAVSIGIGNKSQGRGATSFGYKNDSFGWYGFTAGQFNRAAYTAVALGEDNASLGTASFTSGDSNISNAYAANTFGVRNNNTGAAGFITGADNTSTGRAGFVSGSTNKNYAEAAIVGGFTNVSNESGKYSATFGQENLNNGQSSFICGKLCITNHELSAALGESLTTGGRAQTVVGAFNAHRGDSYFIVGAGSSDLSRSNAFEVRKNKEVWFYHKLQLEKEDASGYYLAMYTGERLGGNGLEGRLHVDGKIACNYITIAGNTLDGTKWTPDSNGY